MSSSSEKPCVCKVCQISKFHGAPVANNPQRRKSENFELVFSDGLGPMPTTSLGGQRFANSFVNNFSRFGAVYFIKSKSECLKQFTVFCAQVGTPKILRTHNSTLLKPLLFLHQKGKKREFTAHICLIELMFANVVGALLSRWHGASSKMQTLITNIV